MTTCICLFEDRQVSGMYPLSLTRPVFRVSCAGWTAYDLARAAADRVSYVVRGHLAGVARRELGEPEKLESAEGLLFLNGAAVPDVRLLELLKGYLSRGEPFIATSGQRIAAAMLPPSTVLPALGSDSVERFLLEQSLPLRDDGRLKLLDYPFHTVQALPELFPANIAALLQRGSYLEVRPGVFAGRNVRIADNAVFHTEHGPVLLEDGVEILDFTYFVGPVILGRDTRVIERSSIKENVSVGSTCKIGGEVEASIIEDYTNKQHHGFLGHAHVGSWVNLGAGTSNSDLKNTYGHVRIEHRGARIDTKMQFFGCVIGDYSKSAINTSIFTGKVIGVNSMLYGYVGQNVASFTNYAASFGQVTECSLDQAVSTQRRMFERRKRRQTPEDIELLKSVYELTSSERRISSEAPVL